jgi:exodeoxyribonuclease VII small subunit
MGAREMGRTGQSNLKDSAGQAGAGDSGGKPGKAPSFEQNLERLESIVRELEDAELPLEKALTLYEEGMTISAACEQQLEAAEGRVEILRKRAGGKLVAEPFEGDEPKAPQA